MAATNQDLKNFFDLTSTNPTITNSQLTSLAEWFTAHTGEENPTPDNFIDYIYTLFDHQVRSHKRSTTVTVWD